MPSEKILEQKKESVKELAAKLKEAKAIILVDYRGVTVEQITKIRAELRSLNAEYKVIKNNITKRALNEIGITDLDEHLQGPVAIAISNEDYLGVSKTLYNFAKENDFYKIKIFAAACLHCFAVACGVFVILLKPVCPDLII